MKKSLALLLSLVLTAGLLSACGKGETPAPSSSMPDEPAVSVIAPVEEPEPEPELEPPKFRYVVDIKPSRPSIFTRLQLMPFCSTVICVPGL